jgi:hypothetical protein
MNRAGFRYTAEVMFRPGAGRTLRRRGPRFGGLSSIWWSYGTPGSCGTGVGTGAVASGKVDDGLGRSGSGLGPGSAGLGPAGSVPSTGL